MREQLIPSIIGSVVASAVALGIVHIVGPKPVTKVSVINSPMVPSGVICSSDLTEALKTSTGFPVMVARP